MRGRGRGETAEEWPETGRIDGWVLASGSAGRAGKRTLGIWQQGPGVGAGQERWADPADGRGGADRRRCGIGRWAGPGVVRAGWGRGVAKRGGGEVRTEGEAKGRQSQKRWTR